MKGTNQTGPIIMVSSSVYNIEDLLDQIFAVLTSFGYTVWMSHGGTIPVNPGKSNFENCLTAVENFDLFLGLITTSYGSGRKGNGLFITHQELLRAIELDKPRWFLAHDHVVFARQLLKQFRLNDDGSLNETFELKPTSVLDDIRVIDMYEAATRQDLALSDRTGNWVQSYVRRKEALQYVNSQFANLERIKALLAERASS